MRLGNSEDVTAQHGTAAGCACGAGIRTAGFAAAGVGPRDSESTPLGKAIGWILRNSIPGGGLILTSRQRVGCPQVTGQLIPTLLRLDQGDLAAQYARWLLSVQREDGSFGAFKGSGGCVFSTGRVIWGWVALLNQMAELEYPLRRACDWILAGADSQTGRLIPPTGCARCPRPHGEVNEGVHLCALASVRRAGEALHEARYTRFVNKSLDYYLKNVNLTDFGRHKGPAYLYACIQEALLDLGCENRAQVGMASATQFQQDTGAVPAYSDVNWVCSAGLAQLSSVWYRLSEVQRADAAVRFLEQLQNPSGGFFGSYGVSADYFPADETSAAVASYVEAHLSKNAPTVPVVRTVTVGATGEAVRRGGQIRIGDSKVKGRVLLVVCLSENNFGDILIHQTVERKIREAGFETEIVEISQPLHQSNLIGRANCSDFLYFVGGGIIERWAPEIIKHFDFLQRHLHVPYGVVGLSTGAFDYAGFSYSLKLFAEKARFFYTRDEESVEAFRKAGAARLPMPGVDVVLANDDIPKMRRTGDAVSASFRNVPYIDITGDIDWIKWSAALKGIGVQFLIPDCSTAQEQLGLEIRRGDVLSQIADSNIIVAMRYHVTLAAAMMGVLPIPISYCPKVRRLAAQLGIEDYCLDQNEHHKLEPTFLRLKSNEKKVREVLAKNVSALRKQANALLRDSIQVMEQMTNGR